MAYTKSGCPQRTLALPKRKLPSARPPIKAVNTVLIAKVVDPKIRISHRVQTIS
jgi:hypothetical protein